MPYLPEVVRIIAAHVEGPVGGKAIGTGFFLQVDGKNIKEEGLLLTNAHVVTNSPVVKIMTTYIEHQALPVTVVSVCHDRDLALLKVEPQVQQWLKRTLHNRYKLDHIPALSFGNSDILRTGFEVHAVGHPLGLIDQQFTTGVYQGPVHLNSEIRGLTSATINGGNSGGPLINSSGCVVGVISFKEVENDDLNFAVSSERLLRFLNNSGYGYLQDNLNDDSIYKDNNFKDNKNYLNNDFATPNDYETDSRIQYVKTGTMNFCDNVDVNTLINNYIPNPNWYAFKADDGEDYVNIEGQIYYFEELVDILLQYQIDVRNGVFKVYAFTIDNEPQTQEMIDSLIESMCDDFLNT